MDFHFAAIKKRMPRLLKRHVRRALSAFYRYWWHDYHLPSTTLQQITGREPQLDFLHVILDDICMPPFLGGTHQDLQSLLTIAVSLKPQLILELGTAFGNTVANLCDRLPDATIYTVNAPVEEQTGSNVTFRLTRDEIGRVYEKHGYASRVTQIFENTLNLDLSKYLPRNSIEMAIIDACHDTEYVINDFLKVEPFVKPGGAVLLHDTHPSMEKHLAGSYKACLILRKQGYDLKHITDTWWGVYLKEKG